MRTVETGKRISLTNVLFATDFSPCANAALPYAMSVARQFGATLHAAHVMPTVAEMLLMSPESWPTLAEQEARRAQTYFKELGKQMQDLPHEVLLPRGKVGAALAQLIEERKIDLLVLGTHGREGFSKLILGSIAEEVFRRTACPVLSIGPNVPARIGAIEFQHILFATDFSADSLAALPYAVSMAEEDQAQLLLLHVVEDPAAAIPDREEVKATLIRRLKGLVPREAETWCHVECLLEFGRHFAPPADRILEVANERAADLIVLGVRPVRGKLGFVTHQASTTAQILTQSACPVLTVRGRCA
jgi:nucleotide-binding universal stress UspA family protein